MPVGVSAYVPLATKTLTATATSVTFSSISQAYRDLVLIASVSGTTDNRQIKFQFNGDTATNYPMVTMYGLTGGAATSSSSAGGFNGVTMGQFLVRADPKNTIQLDIFDYSSTDKHKSISLRQDLGLYSTSSTAARWANTVAITSIVVTLDSSTFIVGSTFTLYGIAA